MDVRSMIQTYMEKTASAESDKTVSASDLIQDYMEKSAAAEEFMEGIEKAAHVLGIDPEYLAEVAVQSQEELIKEAEVDALLSVISEDDAAELLKEAAEQNPEVATALQQMEEAEDNEVLRYWADLIDSMSEEEAQAVLEAIQAAQEAEPEAGSEVEAEDAEDPAGQEE